eukprot:Filipodium_phascolosomae@DN1840_c0_g1_i1.p1
MHLNFDLYGIVTVYLASCFGSWFIGSRLQGVAIFPPFVYNFKEVFIPVAFLVALVALSQFEKRKSRLLQASFAIVLAFFCYISTVALPILGCGGFIILLCLFHLSEYVLTAHFHPESVTVESFLLTNGWEYTVATACAILESVAQIIIMKETYEFIPKEVQLIGFVVAVLGLTMRILAWVTAGFSYNHAIVYEPRKEHKLVTWGIYAYFRHPGYAGWMIYTLGLQLLLRNFGCLLAFYYVCNSFFRDRIYEEEKAMIDIFEEKYRDYAYKTPIRFPFVEGYVPCGSTRRNT